VAQAVTVADTTPMAETHHLVQDLLVGCTTADQVAVEVVAEHLGPRPDHPLITVDLVVHLHLTISTGAFPA